MENVMGIIKNESAQFMLLAGFIIAIGLVITTVMLNNIIFESNMAGEAGGDPIKYDIVNLLRISGDEMKSAYGNATALGGTKENMTANFTNQTQNFSANLPMLYALHGEGVNVSWDVSNWNNGNYANFTDNGTANGATNWTVIEGVDANSVGLFKFWINLSGTNFKIEARNSSGWVWSVEFNNSSPYNVTVTNTTNTSYSNFTQGREVNLTLTQYYFKQSASSNPVSIRIINGNNAYGNFTIQGIANNKNFIRARDYILNATVTISTNNMRANLTIPVSVPW
jgi:hypothetical protein